MRFSLSSLFVSILMVSILTLILSLLMRNGKLFATMSSDELKKLSKKSTFDSSVSNIYSHFLPCVLRANEI